RRLPRDLERHLLAERLRHQHAAGHERRAPPRRAAAQRLPLDLAHPRRARTAVMWKARRMRSGLFALVVAGLALPACSWPFADTAPAFPLVGAPPTLASLQKLNNGPVYGSAIVFGADNAYWLSLQEETKKLRVVRLEEPAQEMTIEGDQFVIAWRAFFV